ncbi:MAG TPA: class I adenylate-forming enzyme family protein, partial [Tissierellaceae bacterium]|nr:class I adenylate-forming enzyme family protein [Tissierellaceae bacterium]
MSKENDARIIEQSERLKDALPRLSDYMWKWVNKMPEHNAFMYHDVPITYKKFSEDVEQVAKYLLKLGIKKGDRVGFLLTVRPEYNVFSLAAAMIGAIAVGMNTRYTVPEMSYVMKHSQPRVILALHGLGDVNYQEMLSKAMEATYQFDKVIVVNGPAELPNAITLEEVLAG